MKTEYVLQTPEIYLKEKKNGIRGVCIMKFQDLGRSARIELAKMAKQLGMKYIGYNPTAQQVSLEYKGKGVTYHVDELVAAYQQSNHPT